MEAVEIDSNGRATKEDKPKDELPRSSEDLAMN
jgi:hypothetical protein